MNLIFKFESAIFRAFKFSWCLKLFLKFCLVHTALHIFSPFLFVHLAGSPFHFHVDELKSGNVTAYGTGLTHGISNEQCHFIINTKDAGAGKSRTSCSLWEQSGPNSNAMGINKNQ